MRIALAKSFSVAWMEKDENSTETWETIYNCRKCAPGCEECIGPEPCLATYHWPFRSVTAPPHAPHSISLIYRITLLVFSLCCVLCTVVLVVYVFKHRKLKVFKVASPIFLSITLLGCATMYLEVSVHCPPRKSIALKLPLLLDGGNFSCAGHLLLHRNEMVPPPRLLHHIHSPSNENLEARISSPSIISRRALNLLTNFRVSLTYRVKSAHKVKLTDKQLLQWMVPILLIMLIYLSTWTLSATPTAEVITDSVGLKFKQCTYNWWDHSLAIGEILFLAWGVRVCYNVRNAESLYNEARLISYAIYNIAIVNITMIAFQ